MTRVLIVEDNDMNRDVLSRWLKRRGFELAFANDGKRAVEVALAERPDLVLMDMSLPVVDGWEATRRLRALPETARLPVIALTSHAMSGDREKALAAGCDDYDTKPIDIERLLAKMAALLSAGRG